ncbi:MAG: hypothetical protein VX811_04445, partial [Pseudomonadota bacterium]|nr:hypothetical protein [Pseudomonadota bacterium]
SIGIMHSLMPNQVLFVSKGDKVPRLLLGRKALALQGFPIEVLDIMDPDGTLWSEATLHDLAVNMVSAPVMLCAVMVAIEAAPWIDIKQEHIVEDQDEDDAVTRHGPVPDTAEAEQEGAVAASGPPSLDDTDLEVRPPPTKFRRGLLSRGIFCRVDGPCPCSLLPHRRAMPWSPGHALV